MVAEWDEDVFWEYAVCKHGRHEASKLPLPLRPMGGVAKAVFFEGMKMRDLVDVGQ